MALTPRQLEALDEYFSSRPRDPNAPRANNPRYEHPEVIQGVPSTGGGNFTAQDLDTYNNYLDTGELASRPNPNHAFPQGIEEALAPKIDAAPVGNVGVDSSLGYNPTSGEPPNRNYSQSLRETLLPGPGEPPNQARGGAQPRELINMIEAQRNAPPEPAPSSSAPALGSAPLASSQGGLDIGHIRAPDTVAADEVQTSRLQSAVEGQRETYAQVTGEEAPQKDDDPGFLSKAFDYVMRPNYMMAEGVSRAQDVALGEIDEVKAEGGDFWDAGEAVTDLSTVWEMLKEGASGAREGITGREKTVFSDVLNETSERLTGEELNPWISAPLGFVMDVALDPTTYVGGGMFKKAGKEALDAVATRAAVAAKNSPELLGRAQATASERVRREVLENLGPGGKTTTKVPSPSKLAKKVSKYADEELEGIAKERMISARKAAAANPDNIGKAQLKIGGQVVAESPKVYDALGRAIRPISQSKPAQFLGRAFNPRVELGENLRRAVRDNEAFSVANFEKSMEAARENLFKGMSKQDRELVSFVMEGTKHSDDPAVLKAAEGVATINKRFFEDEVSLGILREDQFRQNYAYHYYKGDPKAAQTYKTLQAKKGAAGFTKERSYVTYEQAIKDGMKPELDALEVLQMRAAKHFQELADWKIVDEMVNDFGIRIGKKKTKLDKAVIKQLNEMGVGLEEFVGNNGERVFLPETITKPITELRTIKAQDKNLNQFLRGTDKFQSDMKFWLTVANPGHQIRNLGGNMFQGYQGGVRNMDVYRHAEKAIRASRFKADDALKASAKSTRLKVGNKGTESLEGFYNLYVESGTRSGFIATEVADSGASKAGQLIRSFSQTREDIPRLGQFIDDIKKTAPDNWNSLSYPEKVAFARKKGGASEMVKKFQLDYSDTTAFEKKVARRIMMFYTFARKNTVLQMEMLALRPGKLANLKKGQDTISRALGVDPLAKEDEDWKDRIPEWILEMNAPQIGGNDNFVQRIFGTNTDPVYANMLMPTSDLNRIKGPKGIANMLLSEVRPEIGGLIELGTGRDTFTGQELPGGIKYASQQVPVTNLGRKILEHARGEPSGNQDPMMDLASYLTGLSMQRVTPERQRSELRRQQDEISPGISESRRDKDEEFKELSRRIRTGQ